MAAGPTTRTWATGGSPPLPLSLEVCVLPTDLTTGTFSRTHSSESKVLLRPPGLILWLSSIEASRETLKILAGSCRDLLVLWPPRQALYVSSLATYQCRGVCLFLRSLPALLVWGPVQISPGDLPRLWTNTYCLFFMAWFPNGSAVLGVS